MDEWMDGENQFLSDDYSKLALLETDRYFEFHAPWGNYFKLRTPRQGRDILYHARDSHIYIAASGPHIFRFDLQNGQFLAPIVSNSEEGMNVVDQSPVHGMIAFGGENGHVECYDPRSNNLIADFPIVVNAAGEKNLSPITALRFGSAGNGLNMAVGTESGIIHLYDIRSSRPVLIKDHNYDLPIVDLHWHDKDETILSLDNKIIKIWESRTGKSILNIESPQNNDMNNLCIFPDSGLLFAAAEQPKVEVFYIPTLGPAPRWCSFLDNITEELEDDPTESAIIYDDYKFVTREELETLNLSSLIGTPYVRAYMHGFFMDLGLYRKVRDVQAPMAYKEFVRKKVEERRKDLISSRITKKSTPTSKSLSASSSSSSSRPLGPDRFLVGVGGNGESGDRGVSDPRFGSSLENPDFEIDVRSEDYKRTQYARAKNEMKLRPPMIIEDPNAKAFKKDGQRSRPFSSTFKEPFDESSSSSRSTSQSVPRSRLSLIEQLKQKIAEKKLHPKPNPSSSSAAKAKIEARRSMMSQPLSSRLLEMAEKSEESQQFESKVRRTHNGNLEMTFVPRFAQVLPLLFHPSFITLSSLFHLSFIFKTSSRSPKQRSDTKRWTTEEERGSGQKVCWRQGKEKAEKRQCQKSFDVM